jgi:hypothetical protein
MKIEVKLIIDTIDSSTLTFKENFNEHLIHIVKKSIRMVPANDLATEQVIV